MESALIIRRALDKSWEVLRPQMEEALLGELQSQIAAASDQARKTALQSVGQAARWLDKAGNDQQWRMALVDAAAQFCERAALFAVENGRLFCKAASGADISTLQKLAIPFTEAPAFKTAVDTGETVVAIRRAEELSAPVADVFQTPGLKNSFLFPMNSEGHALAILYAEGKVVDVGALELLMSLAAASAKRRTGGLLGASASYSLSPSGSGWNELSREDRNLHLKAQRSAKVRTARLLLDFPLEVQAGRRRKSLYAALHHKIDEERKQFAELFFTGTNTMIDYLHVELVRTLANDDATILGAEYPGPML